MHVPGAVALLGAAAVAVQVGLHRPEYARAPAGADSPAWFRALYAVVPLGVLLLMLDVNVRRSRLAAAAFLCAAALWAPYLNTGRATDVIDSYAKSRTIMFSVAERSVAWRDGPIGLHLPTIGRDPSRYARPIEKITFTYWGHANPRSPGCGPRKFVGFKTPEEIQQNRKIAYLVVPETSLPELARLDMNWPELERWSVDKREYVALRVRREATTKSAP
jgi:hypothetical protein